MKQPSILVVDDEPDNFDVIETFLSINAGEIPSIAPQDYHLHYAASGEDAIAALNTFNPDLILLDVMMPGLDGIQVCQRIKAMSKWRAVPIIMITAFSSKSSLAACLAAGADDFISKPVNGLELRARVCSMLRIKQQYDDLQALLQMREDMVRMIIHDLRNPLCNILLVLDLLKEIDYSKEKQQLKFDQIYRSAQILQISIDDLLKFALLESGKFRLNRTAVDLCALIQTTLEDFEAIAAQKKQVFIRQFAQERQIVLVDVELFRRVLDNLLSNAVKFSPCNSCVTVGTALLPSGASIIQIIDCGSGVPDSLRHQIFEKYEIGTPMSNTAQLGLGLAFCKMVIEAHEGTICVKGNQPKGAIFEIVLSS